MLSSKKRSFINCLLQRIALSTCSFCSSSIALPDQLINARYAVDQKSFATRFIDLIACCSSNEAHPKPPSFNQNDNVSNPALCRTLFVNIVKKVLERLAEPELGSLLNLIENEGCQIGDCLLLSKTSNYAFTCSSSDCDSTNSFHPICLSHLAGSLPPHALLYLSYRSSSESQLSWASENVIYLPWCAQYQNASTHTCINPYHCCVLVRPNASYDPHDSISSQPILPFGEVFSTSDCSNQSSKSTRWCKVAYWEFRDRIGSQFSVRENLINITTVEQHVTRIASLSLNSLFCSSAQVPDVILKIRQKIGVGVTLCRDSENNVWLYNGSSIILFVNSPTIDPPKSLSLEDIRTSVNCVRKVSPGHLIKVFDLEFAVMAKKLWRSSDLPSIDFHSFRLSFVKGFGQNYARSDIMQCPCWMEVMLDETN